MALAIKRWLPFRKDKNVPVKRNGGVHQPMDAVFREMNRMMERFFDDPWSLPSMREDSWFGDFSPERFIPSIDISDHKKYLKITAEMPGMDRDDVEISIQDGMLFLKGEKRAEEMTEEEGYYRTERSFGAFQRVIPLPDEVDAAQAEATFDKGVLTIKLPKTHSSNTKKIEIKST